jgi:hypothetical protein
VKFGRVCMEIKEFLIWRCAKGGDLNIKGKMRNSDEEGGFNEENKEKTQIDESNYFNTFDKFNPNTKQNCNYRQQEPSVDLNNLLIINNTYKARVEAICRVCLSESRLDNPLIYPCKCKGTMKHIHLECLRKWLNSKIVKKVIANTTIYIFNKFKCELCHADIPGKHTFLS